MTPHRDLHRARFCFLWGSLLVLAVGSIAVWWRVAEFPKKPLTPAVGSLGSDDPAGTPPGLPKGEGPGGPILVISGDANPFSAYYAEILRAEGFNEFAVADMSRVRAETLDDYDLVLLGEIPLTLAQAGMLKGWVERGGNLIAMRPEKHLAAMLGLRAGKAGLRDAYLSIDTHSEPGKGLVSDTIQFHGAADTYLIDSKPSGVTAEVAALYDNAKTSAGAPAVLLMKLGAGNAAVFAYDLSRSVVLTRQGNPAWSGMERDGIPPMRSDDLFYGAASNDIEPDWVDLDKVAIPQADEQQRLLANLILEMNSAKKPLPRFWYFPRGLKAVVIMTGDDHGHGGTADRFDGYWAETPSHCSLSEWQCVRATSYVYLGSITPEVAQAATERGFEIGLHIFNRCEDWPRETVRQDNGETRSYISWRYADTLYTDQLSLFHALYPNVPAPVTGRIHCILWGDYDTQPRVEEKHGLRLDTNYYYWPSKWVMDRPGMFTGSGIPMRFARADGSLIDVYQAPTQMTDESGQTYPFTIDRLLDNALGPNEFIGAFTANMHNDQPSSDGADAIVASARARDVPVVTAAQMLRWLDGRYASSFHDLSWGASELHFSIVVGAGAEGLSALLPLRVASGELTMITVNGSPVAYQKRSFAGITYAIFPAAAGKYVARYSG